MDDDDDIARAIAMSMGAEAPSVGAEGGAGGDMNAVLADQEYMSSVLASLPGVDPNDASVREMLASMGGGGAQAEGDKEVKKDEDK
jgi:26S proteasome regulatory subunit N10